MKDRQYPGYLITFEGGEGSGKTSALQEVCKKLRKYGGEVKMLREPGGPVISEEIRNVIIKNRLDGAFMDPLTETFLFQAGRSQTVAEWTWPYLLNGEVVLVDRFRDSSTVYQGFARSVGCGFVDSLNERSTKGLMPDLTILFDVDPEIGLSRRSKGGDVNRLDVEKLEFHREVNWAYRQLAEFDRSYNEKPRWEVVNANLSQEEVLASALKIIEGRLQEAGFLERKKRGVEY
jgi:dTMP kinase